MERALYNCVVSGVSSDGTRFFYDNYLASYPGVHRFKNQSPPERAEWFGCACCPPNIARLLATIGGYIYAQKSNTIYVHLYGESKTTISLGKTPVTIEQNTDYPWRETVIIDVKPSKPMVFTLTLRIPGWCRKATCILNGQQIRPVIRKGYAYIKRNWENGDRVSLHLPMPVEKIEAHPSVRHNTGRVALQRGPVVYCLEEADNGKDLHDIALDPKAKCSVKTNKQLGAPIITTRGKRTYQHCL